MKKILAALIFFATSVHIHYAQTIQDLEESINNSVGLEKVQYQLQLANKIVDSDPKEALTLSKEGLQNSDGNTALEGAGNAIAAEASVTLKSYDDAIKYGKAAAEIYKSSDKNNYAMSESVIAEAFEAKGKTSDAISHYTLAYDVYKEIGKNKNAGFNASSIGMMHNKKGNTKKAVEWYGKAANEFQLSAREKDEVQCLKTVGALYSNYGDYENAKIALTNAKQQANSYGLTALANDIQSSIDLVSNNESSAGQTTAFEDDKNLEKENIISEIKMQNAKSLAEIEMMSEEMQLAELKVKAAQDEATLSFLQKEAAEDKAKLAESEADAAKLVASEAKALEEKILAEKDAESAKARNLWIALAALAIVAILIFIGFLNKKKTNISLTAKNVEILRQKDEITAQSVNINESIDYATRIQKALLPSPKNFATLFPGSFVFLRPKDSVSGDFFWYHKVGNETITVAADCTGHGVPGAFMSIIFSTILDKVVVDEKIFQPDQILESISAILTSKLLERNVKEEEFKDGMDVAVVRINTATRKMEYAGARNAIYVVRDGDLTEIKGSRRSVEVIANTAKIPFALKHYDLQVDDRIFMFSDGFADQKGGEKGKKFYYQPFKDLLLEMSSATSDVPQQLNTKYENWKGKNEQFDDVLVVGIKIS
jgi:serine phosphatase RsbU (regulator of sigma subunit)